MSQCVSITLTAISKRKLIDVLDQITDSARKVGVKIQGALVYPSIDVPLPISDTLDSPVKINFAKAHIMTIEVQAEEMFLRGLMRIQVPDGVNIEIIMRS